MPTIQRLLTDDTGQALVTAINNVVAAVKPNATEIQMSSSNTTTVATEITNINNKIGTVPSGQTVEGQITTLNSKITTLNPSTVYRPLSQNQTEPWTYVSPHDGVLYLTFVGTIRSYIGIRWNGAYLCAVAMPDNSSTPIAQTVTIFVRKNDEIYVPGLSSTCYLIATQTTLVARGADI